jgi:hypothetical protein
MFFGGEDLVDDILNSEETGIIICGKYGCKRKISL